MLTYPSNPSVLRRTSPHPSPWGPILVVCVGACSPDATNDPTAGGGPDASGVGPDASATSVANPADAGGSTHDAGRSELDGGNAEATPDGAADAGCDSGDPCRCATASPDCGTFCVEGCQIDDTCVAAGSLRPQNECEVCDPARHASDWSPREASCDDGLYCTVDDQCVAATCTGQPRNCDDGIACTSAARCDEDANACTPAVSSCRVTETCNATTGNCDVVCEGCIIDGSCVLPGSEQPGDACRTCNPEQSLVAYVIAAGKACGAPASECSGQSTCDATGACPPNYEAAETPCGQADDVSGCDLQDRCDGQGNCEDRKAPNGATCDDALFCSSESRCVSGTCLPSVPTACAANQTCLEAEQSCIDDPAIDPDCGIGNPPQPGGGSGLSGRPAEPPTGGPVAFETSVGNCPPFALQPLAQHTWGIAAVRFLPDGSADVLIENTTGNIENFGDLFAVCNTQPNCVFVHDDVAGIDVAPGELRMTVNVPNTFIGGGELAVYTNNLSIPHTDTVPESALCDLFTVAFAWDYLAWGTGPSGDHVLYEDATRDFAFWTSGERVTIAPGDTGFVATGNITQASGYTSCKP